MRSTVDSFDSTDPSQGRWLHSWMVFCQTRLSLQEELFLGLSAWWGLMRALDLSVGLDGLSCGLLCPTDCCMLKGQCTWCGMRFPRHGKPMACPFGKGIQTETFFRCFWNVSLGETGCLTYWGHLTPSSLSCSNPPFILCITLILLQLLSLLQWWTLPVLKKPCRHALQFTLVQYPCKNLTLKILDLNAVIVPFCVILSRNVSGEKNFLLGKPHLTLHSFSLKFSPPYFGLHQWF